MSLNTSGDELTAPGLETALPRRAWWRRSISLRGLMLLVVALGGGVGWVTHEARVQRDAVAAVTAAGGDVYYDWQYDKNGFRNPKLQPPGPAWLVGRLGIDYFANVRGVFLIGGQGDRADDALMTEIARLRHLEELSLNGSEGVTNAGFLRLHRLTSLRKLDASFTGVDGAGLDALRAMGSLEEVNLISIHPTDDEVRALAGLTGLEKLDLGARKLTDAGMEHL